MRASALRLLAHHSAALANRDGHILCIELNMVHVGLPTKRSGVSSSTVFLARAFLLSSSSKSRGTPSSSVVIRSNAKLGAMDAWGEVWRLVPESGRLHLVSKTRYAAGQTPKVLGDDVPLPPAASH